MNVLGFISLQSELSGKMLVVLRSWILDLGPHVQEKISYKVPFFYFFGPLCYLSCDQQGVSLSFVKGYELSNDQNLLEVKGRKYIRSITFFSLAELEEHEEDVRHLLNEAAILNEFQFKQKKKHKK
jgi:hypothetical protein